MKLLLIDDDLKSLESLSEALSFNGYPIEQYSNPVEAVNAYNEKKFDVVITDFKMPELNGIEVLKKVKEIDPKAYVIILTGFADIEIIRLDSWLFVPWAYLVIAC